MSAAKTSTGGCHCGAVRYEALVDLSQVMECNCSFCARRGALWSFVKGSDFKLLSDVGALADYQFGKRSIRHLFCPRCGVGSFSRGASPDGSETIAVNVRCLDGVDVAELTPIPFDGRSL